MIEFKVTIDNDGITTEKVCAVPKDIMDNPHILGAATVLYDLISSATTCVCSMDFKELKNKITELEMKYNIYNDLSSN